MGVLLLLFFLQKKNGKIMYSNITPKLHPYYVTGFTDGEGSFIVKILKRSKMNTGYEVQLSFSITNHSRGRALLESIKGYFGGIGSLLKDK